MNIVVPWGVMVAWLSYQHGWKQGKLPEPHYFLGATAAMMIASIVGMANNTVGTLFAWALVAGVFVSERKTFPSVPAGSESSKGAEAAAPKRVQTA